MYTCPVPNNCCLIRRCQKGARGRKLFLCKLMQLRPYQNELIEKTRAEMRAGFKSILIQAPTGTGKTALTVAMLKAAAERGLRSWFLNHRRELIRQSSRAFSKDDVYHGIIAANFQ